MRFSLFGVFFLAYAVSALPVLQHRVNSISRALVPDHAAPAGPGKTPASVLFELKTAPPFDARSSKIHPLPERETAKALHSSRIKKRADDSVEAAICSRTTIIGTGNVGIVYKTKFEGKDAVLKVIDTTRPGGNLQSVKKEVTNLKTVKQFLGWAERNTKKGHILYVVMPDMGVPHEKTGLTQDQLQKLMEKAIKFYRDTYHMENKDKNSNNYVYRKVNGQWQAEIIDWARATYTGTAPQPDPGEPKQITASHGCLVM